MFKNEKKKKKKKKKKKEEEKKKEKEKKEKTPFSHRLARRANRSTRAATQPARY